MKQILFLLIGIAFFSCNQSENKNIKLKSDSEELTVNSDNFDWLLGKWKRLNEEEGKETFENWEKISTNEYFGIGFTMQNGDTISQEKIRLIKSEGNWNLEVKLPEEPESVIFKMIKFNAEEFICENKENEFPNKIRYWKNGNTLNASVSNSEMEIPFEFERISN